jgi:hypothetical protein
MKAHITIRQTEFDTVWDLLEINELYTFAYPVTRLELKDLDSTYRRLKKIDCETLLTNKIKFK